MAGRTKGENPSPLALLSFLKRDDWERVSYYTLFFHVTNCFYSHYHHYHCRHIAHYLLSSLKLGGGGL